MNKNYDVTKLRGKEKKKKNKRKRIQLCTFSLSINVINKYMLST